MFKKKIINVCEFTGSVLAMLYALLIASNTGNEILGFSLLLNRKRRRRRRRTNRKTATNEPVAPAFLASSRRACTTWRRTKTKRTTRATGNLTSWPSSPSLETTSVPTRPTSTITRSTTRSSKRAKASSPKSRVTVVVSLQSILRVETSLAPVAALEAPS